MTENTIKWVLFCLLATTVPVLYYMFVVGGSAVRRALLDGIVGLSQEDSRCHHRIR